MKKIFTLLLFTSISFSQDIDTTYNLFDNGIFGNGQGFNGNVYSTTIQKDNKIIIGGEFTKYNGVNVNNIARLNANGSNDILFNIGNGFNGVVRCIQIQNDGKIVVGGNFSEFNGTLVNKIARLNIDGTLDTNFIIGNGFNNDVYTIKIQPDGKILVGGNFTSFDGTSKKYIIRLNSNGTSDNTFNYSSDYSYQIDGPVHSIDLQSDNKIILVGQFNCFNRKNIARLNTSGAIDTNFLSVGTDLNYSSLIKTVKIQADDKILIGGTFSKINGVDRNYFARLNPNGSYDNSLNYIYFNNHVETISTQLDGKIMVGGSFSNRIFKLDINGIIDNTFALSPEFSGQTPVYSLSIQSDEKIIVGGMFSGNRLNKIARINSNGTLDSNFNPFPGFNGTVKSITNQSDGKIIVGGNFSIFNGVERKCIARLNHDGSLDESFNPSIKFNQITSTTFPIVNTIAVQSDGKIIIGGQFVSNNDIPIKFISRLNQDGSIDTNFNTGDIFNSTINTISIQSDGKIIVGGEFYTQFAKKITRLNYDGSKDINFNPPIYGSLGVFATVIQEDGKILVGGWIQNGINRLNPNGSIDSTFIIPQYNELFNGSINSINIQLDGKIIVAGDFTGYNCYYGNNCLASPIKIARLNSDASLDTSFNTGNYFTNNSINCVSLDLEGSIYVGSGYSQNDNKKIVKLNQTGTSKINLIDTALTDIYCIKIQNDNKILVGGRFFGFANNSKNGIFRLFNINWLNYSDYDYFKNEIIIFPNPTSSSIKINNNFFNYKNFKYHIFNNLGLLIKEGNMENEITEIELNKFINQAGIYLIKFTDSHNNISSQKIIFKN